MLSVYITVLAIFEVNDLCYLPLETLEFRANYITFIIAHIKQSPYAYRFFTLRLLFMTKFLCHFEYSYVQLSFKTPLSSLLTSRSLKK